MITTEILFKDYWQIFLDHICEFSKLEPNFIERYEYELDWHSISKNKQLDWTIDFIEQYEDRLVWHELAWNSAIVWDIEKIEKFKKRLDWYYLGRNENLPLSEAFIEKYAKKIQLVLDYNPYYTEALKEKYKLYALKTLVIDPFKLETLHEDEVDALLKSYDRSHNQRVLYETAFVPVLNALSLDEIFKNKFNYSQRYYFLTPKQRDVSGLTPEFNIDNGLKIFAPFKDSNAPYELTDPLVLRNGSLQEGQDRLYEIPRLNSYISSLAASMLLVSENVKEVLAKFKLPEHVFHPVTMVHQKIKSDTKYFVLHCTGNTLFENMDFSATGYHYRSEHDMGEEKIIGALSHKITDYDDFNAAQTKLREEFSKRVIILQPDAFNILTDLDLYTFKGEVVVNEYVKRALENNFLGQIAFKSAQLLNIHIDQDSYDAKASLNINTKISSKVSYLSSEDDLFYQAKKERLEQHDAPVDMELLTDEKFKKKEISLNVIFPKNFRAKVLNKTLKIKGYKLMPIGSYYIQDEYSERYPETHKSVAIAENGIGDTINLLLEKDSDYKLQERLFEFFHETGEYEEL